MLGQTAALYLAPELCVLFQNERVAFWSRCFQMTHRLSLSADMVSPGLSVCLQHVSTAESLHEHKVHQLHIYRKEEEESRECVIH